MRVSKQLCSKLKARDLSSCEISLCETGGPGPASRHASVSFGSLPGSSESSSEGGDGEGDEDGGEDGEEEEGIKVISETPARPDSSFSFLRRPSFLFHHSAESCSSQATATTETTQDHQRRVSYTYIVSHCSTARQ